MPKRLMYRGQGVYRDDTRRCGITGKDQGAQRGGLPCSQDITREHGCVQPKGR